MLRHRQCDKIVKSTYHQTEFRDDKVHDLKRQIFQSSIKFEYKPKSKRSK